jgi:rare lipoprotein A
MVTSLGTEQAQTGRSANFKWGTRVVFTAAVFLTLSAFVKETATGAIDLPIAFTVHAAERIAPVAFTPDISKLSVVTAPALPTLTPTPAPVKKPRSFAIATLTRGMASWYGKVLQDHLTASGRRFDMFELTAAHRSLPFGSQVRVTDLRNHKSVIVTITDRGVLDADRVIDLSFAAAQQLDMIKSGVDPVSLEVLTARQLLARNSIPNPEPDPASPRP